MTTHTSQSHGLSLRSDLVCRKVQMGAKEYWVVKDPVALSFFYFTEREFAVLQMLESCSTLPDVVEEYSRQFAPEHLSGNALITFLADARKNGLINISSVIESTNTKPPEDSQRRRGWMSSSLLSIKLPGFNSATFLDYLYPWCRPLFSKGFLLFGFLLFITAATLFVTQFERFVSQLPDIQSWTTPSVILATVITIGITKVLHELAHALCCKHFGGECREMGVMFLVFVPCLYCDVSDAWLFPSRRQRILVSSAGMIVEMMLASIATLLWFFSVDGPVQTICLTVMTICTISTLLANGNPLMRYDGYFILSDLIGIPNLAGESSGLISQKVKRWVWGLPQPVKRRANTFSPLLLASYGVLSGMYRLFIMTVIMWGMYHYLKSYQLTPVAWMFSCFLIGGMVVSSTKQYLLPPENIQFRQKTNPFRRLIVGLIVIGVIVIGMLIPLPRSISTPLIIEPQEAREVFVVVPGLLIENVSAGTEVKQNDVIGQLENVALNRKLLAAKNEEQVLSLQLEQLQLHRGKDPQSAAKIPSVTQALAASVSQRQQIEKQLRQLTLYAPRAGVVLSPPNRPKQPANEQVPAQWFGTPLDKENRNCYLERGTLYSLVGDPQKIVVVLIVSQREIALVQLKDSVEIYLPGFSNNSLTGEVIEIDPAPITNVPRELIAKQEISIDPHAKSRTKPKEPHYRVRVKILASVASIPIRTTGYAKIKVKPASLFNRLQRLLRDSFQFEL